MRSLWQKQCVEDVHLNKSASSMLSILTKTVACGGVAPRRNDVTFVANESFRASKLAEPYAASNILEAALEKMISSRQSLSLE